MLRSSRRSFNRSSFRNSAWDVPHSASWQLFFNNNQTPNPALSSSTSSTSSSPLPVYSSAYRHLLNIRSNSGLDDELEDDFDQGRYKTRVDKEWSRFGELGFSDVDEKKLEFDLTESERAVPTAPAQPMSWVRLSSSSLIPQSRAELTMPPLRLEIGYFRNEWFRWSRTVRSERSRLPADSQPTS